MYCKWCGMESQTADRCDWCHREFPREGEGQPTAAPPRPEMADLRPLGPEPPPTARPRAAAPSAPQQPLAAETALPSAPSPKQLRRVGDFGYRLEKFLAWAGVATAVTMFLMRLAPTLLWLLVGLNLFICGLLLASTRTIGPFEDQWLEAIGALMLCFGLALFAGQMYLAVPVITLVLFAIAALALRPSDRSALGVVATWAVAGLLLQVYAGSVSGGAEHSLAEFFGQAGHYLQPVYLGAGLAGWMASSFFLPLNQ